MELELDTRLPIAALSTNTLLTQLIASGQLDDLGRQVHGLKVTRGTQLKDRMPNSTN